MAEFTKYNWSNYVTLRLYKSRQAQCRAVILKLFVTAQVCREIHEGVPWKKNVSNYTYT